MGLTIGGCSPKNSPKADCRMKIPDAVNTDAVREDSSPASNNIKSIKSSESKTKKESSSSVSKFVNKASGFIDRNVANVYSSASTRLSNNEPSNASVSPSSAFTSSLYPKVSSEREEIQSNTISSSTANTKDLDSNLNNAITSSSVSTVSHLTPSKYTSPYTQQSSLQSPSPYTSTYTSPYTSLTSRYRTSSTGSTSSLNSNNSSKSNNLTSSAATSEAPRIATTSPSTGNDTYNNTAKVTTSSRSSSGYEIPKTSSLSISFASSLLSPSPDVTTTAQTTVICHDKETPLADTTNTSGASPLRSSPRPNIKVATIQERIRSLSLATSSPKNKVSSCSGLWYARMLYCYLR